MESRWPTFSIVGDVDDGKSTLTGRLVLGAQNFYIDQLPLKENLASFSDGLKEEQQKGITIDIAYRFLSIKNRRLRLIDCPGHDQYFSKTLTALSLVDLVIVVIDINRSVTSQTKKILKAIHKLAIEHVVIAINKVDSVVEAQSIYEKVCRDTKVVLDRLNLKAHFLPISALNNLNISHHNIDWFKGLCLYDFFDFALKKESDSHLVIQDVKGHLAFGHLLAGYFQKNSLIKKMYHGFHEVDEVRAPAAIAFELKEGVKLERGDIWSSHSLLTTSTIQAEIFCYQGTLVSGQYSLYMNFKVYPVLVKIHSSEQDFIQAEITSDIPITYLSYQDSKLLGKFILMDEKNTGVGAGIIVS